MALVLLLLQLLLQGFDSKRGGVVSGGKKA